MRDHWLLCAERMRQLIRLMLPLKYYKYLAEVVDAVAGVYRVGPLQYIRLRSLRDHGATDQNSSAVALKLRGIKNPVWIRPHTSDAGEIIHTIVRRAYRPWFLHEDVRTIIDAGANIGDTVLWYLSRFPAAKIVAIEPADGNFSCLERNCRPYSDRVTLVKAALWPTTTTLQIVDHYKYSGISVRAIEDAPSNGHACRTITPLQAMAIHQFSRIDLFKIDIEGAEAALFANGCDEWLDKTQAIYIELHGNEALQIVLRAVGRHGFRSQVYRDLHIFYRGRSSQPCESFFSRRAERLSVDASGRALKTRVKCESGNFAAADLLLRDSHGHIFPEASHERRTTQAPN